MRTCSAIALLSLLSSSVASAQTGSISGRVVFDGPRPQRPAEDIPIDTRVCGASERIMSEDLIVSDRTGLANVALFLTDAPEGAAKEPVGSELNQKNCTFSPHVQTVSVGSELSVGNSDPIIHNVHALLDERTVFNLAMPLKDVRVRRKLITPGIMAIQCDSGHTWMKAYIVVLPHPYHATTSALGEFEIKDVPPGTYTLRAWHETLGANDQRITVAADQAAVMTIHFSKSAEPTMVSAVKIAPPDAAAPILFSGSDAQAQWAMKEQRRADVQKRGRDLYVRHCSACHGDNGDGKGEQAQFCDPAPRDFTRGEFKFRSTPSGSLARVEDLVRTISTGLSGTDMPAWAGTLTRDQIRTLAELVTTFSPRYAKEDPPPPLIIPPETPSNAASIERGKLLYKRLQCAQCHGEAGRGDGVSTKNTRAQIKVADLSSGRYKGGHGAVAVYRAISTGLSGSAMPSFSALATSSELWDIAHFVESLHRSRGLIDYLSDPVNRRSLP
jgi:cytochrome c oxidase cbb3-type subunit 2